MNEAHPQRSDRVDPELVAAAQQGNPQALEQLIRLTQNDVYTLARRLVADPEEALDVAQEAYVRAIRSLNKFRGDSAFSTWMYRITANVAFTHRAKAKKRRAESLERLASEKLPMPASNDEPPERAAITAIAFEEVVEALDRLPEGSRAVVVLKDIYGMSHEEIAEALGITVAACKVRLFRARQRLKDALVARGSAAAGA
jgi:RNA polymerase sigma-70 factor (ECF subfamily)